LGKFISKPVDWSPLDHFKDINHLKQKIPPKEDMWQFTTFLVPPQIL
jgi:homospermidine synthase